MSAQIINFRPEGEHQWSKWAECAKPGAPGMFPNDSDSSGVEAAKATCANCPVRSECLAEALGRGEQWGVWGGHTADERTYRRSRNQRVSRRTGVAPLTPLELADQVVLDAQSLGTAS